MTTSTSQATSNSSTDNSSSTSSNRPASASSASSSTSNASSSSRLAPQFAPRDQRPAICGPEAPERPYPIYLRGEVEKGFGRGGKDLGCPTANLPSKVLGPASALSRTGIYYGFARVLPQDPDDPDIDDSLSLGGGIESAKSPSSPPTPQQDQLDEEGEESDYYDEDDDENEVVLGVSPVNTHFSTMDRNLNGNANENGSSSSNGNGNDSQLRRNNSLHAGVERVPKHKERQGSKSSTKSNKSIATLMAQLGKSDSNTNDGEGSNSNSNGANKIESSEVKSSQNLSSIPTDNEVEKSATSNAQDRPTISTSDLNSSTNTSTKHPRNLSAASSSSSLKRGRKKPRTPLREEDAFVFPMVMSVGWNPFYNNTTKTAEVHIIHKFARDFYGLEIRVVVLGYIRPEYNYVDRESLIEDIETDKKVGIASLQRRAYQDYAVDPFLGR